MVWVLYDKGLPVTRPDRSGRNLTIRSISGGRDDFGHAAFRVSDGEFIFRFDMGRAYTRPLTIEERAAHPDRDLACVWQIVDHGLTSDQRQTVLEWLQAEEDDSVMDLQLSTGKRREHGLVFLESVSGIDGY
ncbi:MAG: hypothetical protein V4564_15975 [Pseudomonadota bacterium]|uniref:hypothetical protein n=1 Tax=Sphingomonas sp. ERG5 TaxID=1381597 RepID=UPI00054B3CE2|nr:hypothetical protein [Sphingomonas sp. ERG5]